MSQGVPARDRRRLDLGQRLEQELTSITTWRGKPASNFSNNGTEFTFNAMLAWRIDNPVDWHLIAPGKPMQKAFVESFNGRMCNAFLNEDVGRTSRLRRQKGGEIILSVAPGAVSQPKSARSSTGSAFRSGSA